MLSNSFDQALFSNMIIEVFLEIRLTDKTQGSEPTKQEYLKMLENLKCQLCLIGFTVLLMAFFRTRFLCIA